MGLFSKKADQQQGPAAYHCDDRRHDCDKDSFRDYHRQWGKQDRREERAEVLRKLRRGN